MLRYDDITSGLLHLVGWQQGYAGDIQIDSSLTESQSGIFFQQVHPLLTLENIRSIAPEFSTVDGSEEAFSNWLEQKTKASIFNAVSRFCNMKASTNAFKQLVENKQLFSGTGRIYDTERRDNKLVGFEITPIRSRGITTRIDNIGLQFTTAGSYTLYLFHSSSYEPIYTTTCVVEKPMTMQWFKPEAEWNLRNRHVDNGGSWYLVYAQQNMPQNSKAIVKNYDWSKAPCNTCSRTNVILWEAWSKYIEVHPFSVDMQDVPIDDDTLELRLWDVEKNEYQYDTNHGLNLAISVSCDITDFILEQKQLFADVIAKQLAVDMLKEFAYNPSVRTNRHAINASRMDILYAIDGDSASLKQSGLSYELDQAMKALDLSTRGQDRVCLPCANGGLKWRAV